VALEHRGEVVVGAMALPVLGETYWAARGEGCFKNGQRLHVGRVADWDDAVLSLGELPGLLGGPQGHNVTNLVKTAIGRVASAIWPAVR
jgi:histidinol-phosphatase